MTPWKQAYRKAKFATAVIIAKNVEGLYFHELVGEWLDANSTPRLASMQHTIRPSAARPASGRPLKNVVLHGLASCGGVVEGCDSDGGGLMVATPIFALFFSSCDDSESVDIMPISTALNEEQPDQDLSLRASKSYILLVPACLE